MAQTNLNEEESAFWKLRNLPLSQHSTQIEIKITSRPEVFNTNQDWFQQPVRLTDMVLRY